MGHRFMSAKLPLLPQKSRPERFIVNTHYNGIARIPPARSLLQTLRFSCTRIPSAEMILPIKKCRGLLGVLSGLGRLTSTEGL